MKFLLHISILLLCLKAFTQTSLNDINIYNSFLDSVVHFEIGGYKKIRLIPRFQNSRDPFYKDIIDLKEEIEEIRNGTYTFQYTLLHGENLRERFIENPSFMESMYQLVSHFDNHPRIDKNKIDLDSVQISYDSYSPIARWFRNKSGKVLSRVTFSRIQCFDDICTFYFSYSCGDLCGYGGIAFMEKRDEKWVYLGSFEMWMS